MKYFFATFAYLVMSCHFVQWTAACIPRGAHRRLETRHEFMYMCSIDIKKSRRSME